jgi:hypothetical protein
MKTKIKYAVPWLAAATIGASVALAPIAGAETDPLVPPGSDPHVPYQLGLHVSNHDEVYTTRGDLDLPS